MKIDRSEEFSRMEREHIRLETGQLSEPERDAQRREAYKPVRLGVPKVWDPPVMAGRLVPWK